MDRTSRAGSSPAAPSERPPPRSASSSKASAFSRSSQPGSSSLVTLPRAPRFPERLRPQREHGLGLGSGLEGGFERGRRGAEGPELPYEPIAVRPRDRHPPGGERAGAEQPLHGPHVLVLELEGGGDGTPLRDALPIPRELAARVVAQIDERLGVTGGDRIEAIEGLEESGLSALVLADEAGDVGLNLHLAGIQDVLVLSDSYRSQNHVGVPVRRPPRAALAGCRFIERMLPGRRRAPHGAGEPAGRVIRVTVPWPGNELILMEPSYFLARWFAKVNPSPTAPSRVV